MTTLLFALWKDEAGFIVSAELVLIATIAVLAMVVGLAEVANAINQELEDVASAFGAVNQSYRYQGLTGHGGTSNGTSFNDAVDFCDGANDIASTAPTPEGGGQGGSW
jgi:Flp pilus assembly pilin Flp